MTSLVASNYNSSGWTSQYSKGTAEPVFPQHEYAMSGDSMFVKVPVAETFSNYDYIRFSFSDINGISRGQVIPCRHIDKLLKNGISAWAGTIALGPRSQDSTLKEVEAMQHGNAYFKPVLETLHPLPWAGGEKYRIGEMICEPFWQNNTPQAAGSRYLARRQLQRLESRGLQMMSAYEMEFCLLDGSTKLPLFKGVDCFSNFFFSEQESLLLSIDDNMSTAGVEIEAMHTEYGPGQYEMVLAPTFGIKAADNVFIFKEGVKEICSDCNTRALFLTKPFIGAAPNGCHFNHSLWHDGHNAFFDKEEGGLSTLARHWLGGLLKHARGLCALFSPTVNCYRRLDSSWAPSEATWGMDNRQSMIRAKTGSASATYFENRLSSSAANPYLIMAGTIAAGLAGVDGCIEPSAENVSQLEIPRTLGEALDALEADEMLVEALGKQFIEWFVTVKREVELHELAQSDVTVEDEKAFEAERKMYCLI